MSFYAGFLSFTPCGTRRILLGIPVRLVFPWRPPRRNIGIPPFFLRVLCVVPPAFKDFRCLPRSGTSRRSSLLENGPFRVESLSFGWSPSVRLSGKIFTRWPPARCLPPRGFPLKHSCRALFFFAGFYHGPCSFSSRAAALPFSW